MRHLRLLGILGFLVSPLRPALAGEGGTPQDGWLAAVYATLPTLPPLTTSLLGSALKSNPIDPRVEVLDRATAIREGLSIDQVLDCEDPDRIALIVAAREQKWDILRALLLDEEIRNNYDRNQVDAEYKSALVWALEKGCPHLDILGSLFTDLSLSYEHPTTKERLLHIAVRGTISDDNTIALQWLLRKYHPCYFIELKDAEGKTPLMNVQCTKAVLLLRSVGADVDATAKGLSVAEWIENSSTSTRVRRNVPSVMKEYAPSVLRIKSALYIQRVDALTKSLNTNDYIDDKYVTEVECWVADSVDESCYEIEEIGGESPGAVTILDEEDEKNLYEVIIPQTVLRRTTKKKPRRRIECLKVIPATMMMVPQFGNMKPLRGFIGFY